MSPPPDSSSVDTPHPSPSGDTTRVSFIRRLEDPKQRTETMRELLAYYQGFIVGVAEKLCPSKMDAEEVAQQAMLNLAKRFQREFVYNARKGRFRSYLRRTVENAYFKLISDRKRDGKLFKNGLDDAEVDARLPDTTMARNEVEEALRLHELEEILPEAITGLRAEHRELFWATVYQNAPMQEIAREYGVSNDYLYAIRKRAKDEIRAHLRRSDDESDAGLRWLEPSST